MSVYFNMAQIKLQCPQCHKIEASSATAENVKSILLMNFHSKIVAEPQSGYRKTSATHQ